jgi:hypothetical protein
MISRPTLKKTKNKSESRSDSRKFLNLWKEKFITPPMGTVLIASPPILSNSGLTPKIFVKI